MISAALCIYEFYPLSFSTSVHPNPKKNIQKFQKFKNSFSQFFWNHTHTHVRDFKERDREPRVSSRVLPISSQPSLISFTTTTDWCIQLKKKIQNSKIQKFVFSIFEISHTSRDFKERDTRIVSSKTPRCILHPKRKLQKFKKIQKFVFSIFFWNLTHREISKRESRTCSSRPSPVTFQPQKQNKAADWASISKRKFKNSKKIQKFKNSFSLIFEITHTSTDC